MTYAGSAQRIFMLRRRADGRAEMIVYTAAATALVAVTWLLLTLRVVVTWLLTELLETRRESHIRQRREQRRQLDAGADRFRGRERRPQPQRQLLERTASVGQELLPTVEAVSAAWHRGKHAAGRQVSEFGRANELVSDDDREQVIEELQHHMVAGRLTIEELEYRVGIAHSARTRADLDRARDHLPRPTG